LDVVIWNLFVIWCLQFVISPMSRDFRFIPTGLSGFSTFEIEFSFNGSVCGVLWENFTLLKKNH